VSTSWTTRWVPSIGAACALLVLAGCAAAPAPQPGAAAPSNDSSGPATIAAAQAIALLQSQWRRALTTGDTAFFARTLADDFQLTGGQSVLNKDEFLAAVARDSGRIPPGHPEQTRIRIYRNVAVVTGLIRYEIPGGAPPLPSRYTEVWVKDGERWRVVHGHYNPILAPPSGAAP
jgi:hypothetical protein